jgi:hypothetical protein
MNMEAENMIDRFIWRRFLPAFILLALAVAALIFFYR